MAIYQERRCYECGKGTIRLTAKPGRKDWYRRLLLPVPDDLLIPTCDVCGEEGLRGDMVEAYDAAMDAVYAKEMQRQTQELLDAITRQMQVTQKHIEQLLGLSHGYLSKVKSGAEVPSPLLLSNLVLLASNPENIRWLE